MNSCPYCNCSEIDEKLASVRFSCGSTMSIDEAGVTSTDKCSSRSREGAEAALWKAMLETDRLFNRSIGILDQFVSWPNELASLYLQLQVIPASKKEAQGKDSNEVLLIHACIAARHELAAGVLSLFRGRVNDSMHNTRKAVEFAIFAAWGVEKEGAATAWLCAVNSDEDWHSYRELFKIHTLLKRSKWKRLEYLLDSLQRLFIDYEQCSKRVHATFLSAGSKIINESVLVDLAIRDTYGAELDAEELITLFLWTIGVHLDILDLLEKLMQDLDCAPEQGWREWFSAVEKSIRDIHK